MYSLNFKVLATNFAVLLSFLQVFLYVCQCSFYKFYFSLSFFSTQMLPLQLAEIKTFFYMYFISVNVYFK